MVSAGTTVAAAPRDAIGCRGQEDISTNQDLRTILPVRTMLITGSTRFTRLCQGGGSTGKYHAD
jgi:hypothetical protein